jgi:hypothetical protein
MTKIVAVKEVQKLLDQTAAMGRGSRMAAPAARVRSPGRHSVRRWRMTKAG